MAASTTGRHNRCKTNGVGIERLVARQPTMGSLIADTKR
jgi:hypothetical protein